MSNENIEAVKALFAAWKERNPEAAMKLIDPDIEVDMTGVASFPGQGVVDRGHDGLQRVITAWLEPWESLEWLPEHFIEAGDHVIVWVRVAGRGRKSGIPVEEHMAADYRVRNGLVVAFRGFDTLAAAASAVGI